VVGGAPPRPAGLKPGLPCDALFTDQRHIALGIKVADCLPVALCDPLHRVIANIHSGWRGAAQNITAETLDTLARETAFDPSVAYAYLGPSIRVCCFEVGEEVAAQFDARWIDRGRGPKPHVDLARMTESILRERGVAHVIDTGFCTRCNPLFHSYRRDKKSGRNLAIAAQ
jgi:YfiH family protein